MLAIFNDRKLCTQYSYRYFIVHRNITRIISILKNRYKSNLRVYLINPFLIIPNVNL